VRKPRSERATKARRRRQDRLYAFDRYVDASVIIKVVVSDPKGEIETPNGLRVREIRRHHRGCVFDTKSSPPRMMPGRWYGDGADPKIWLVSEDQEPLVLHSDEAPRGALVIGSMGAGKTTALAMWHFLRWIENACEYREGGQTAPTTSRLGLVRTEIDNLWCPNWKRWVERPDFTGYELCDGTRIRFRYTHQQSAAGGSPIDGFNWSWCGRDETQDQVEAHERILARGRSAKRGGTYYKQLCTATEKDDPDWRTLRDQLPRAKDVNGKPLWLLVRLLGRRSPFMSEAHWEALKAGMTARQYAIIVEAQDLPSESRLYSTWDRAHNLRPVPLVGARKVTSIVLRAKTGNPLHTLLVGHDPGAAKAASVFLDAFDVPGEGICWWVRAELFTLHKTSEEHALDVLGVVRRFGCNTGYIEKGVQYGSPEIAHVRALPLGQAIDKADQDIYRIWSRVGLDIKSAQYKTDGTGTGQIPRESRIEMVKIMLCDAAGRRRLFVDCDEQRRPKAPLLVEAFETLERDERGQISKDKRLEYDKSDPPDALGYALWPFEKEAAKELRAAVTRGLAGRRG
jgi:hypothetical protein